MTEAPTVLQDVPDTFNMMQPEASPKDDMGWLNIDTTAFAEEIVAAAAASDPTETAKLVRSFFKQPSSRVLSPPVSLLTQSPREIPPLLPEVLPAVVVQAAAAAPSLVITGHSALAGQIYECSLKKRDGGLGLTLACVDEGVQITDLAAGSPADGSGILKGDFLVSVGGAPVAGLPFASVITRLKSQASTSLVSLKRTAAALNDRRSLKKRKVEKIIDVVTTGVTTSTTGGTGLSSSSETPSINQQDWNLRVCLNDRDRHWHESKRLRRQLELNAACQQQQQALLWQQVHKLERVVAEAADASYVKLNDSLPEQVAQLNRKLFSMEAKIREYEIREVRRSAEAASQRAKEKRHALAEAERVKVFLVDQLESGVRLCELKAGLVKPIRVQCEGVRLSVFQHLFPSRDLTFHSVAAGSVYDFQLEDVSARKALGSSFQLLVRTSGTERFILELVKKRSMHVTFDAEFEILRLACLFECSRVPVDN